MLRRGAVGWSWDGGYSFPRRLMNNFLGRLRSLPIDFRKRAASRLYPRPIAGLDPLPVKKRAADPEPVGARFQEVRQRLQIDPSGGKQFDVRQRRFQSANIAGADALSRKYFDHHGAEFP